MSVRPIRCLQWLAYALLVAFAPAPALADLSGWPTRPAALSAAEQQLVTENPAIAGLQADHPWLVRAILTQLTVPAPVGRETNVPVAPSTSDTRILGANPALGQLWRSNPDATLSLLRLIRNAAQTGATRANSIN